MSEITEGFERLIEMLSQMEVDQLKAVIWQAVGMMAIREHPDIREEILSAGSEEFISGITAKIGSKWDKGAIQDAVLEFLNELKAVE